MKSLLEGKNNLCFAPKRLVHGQPAGFTLDVLRTYQNQVQLNRTLAPLGGESAWCCQLQLVRTYCCMSNYSPTMTLAMVLGCISPPLQTAKR